MSPEQSQSRCVRLSTAPVRRNNTNSHATLWRVALGRHSTVAELFRTQQDMRMASLFKCNFALPENKTAATYVSVAKHRLLATAIFILAEDVRGTLNLVKSRN